jgi:hypothetical protein
MMKNKNSFNNKNKDPFDPNANKEVKELTHKALVSFLREQLSEQAVQRKDIDVLTAQILEFLNCFILIGYNFDGKPVTLISAHNQQEADSLGALLNKFLLSSAEDKMSGD